MLVTALTRGAGRLGAAVSATTAGAVGPVCGAAAVRTTAVSKGVTLLALAPRVCGPMFARGKRHNCGWKEIKATTTFPLPKREKARRCEFNEETGEIKMVAKRMEIVQMPKKVGIVARMVRRMPVDQALRQLEFSVKKAAKPIHETITRATQDAWKRFQFPPGNLYVAESYVTKGQRHKTIDHKGRGGYGILKHTNTNYYLTLKQGPPPLLDWQRRFLHPKDKDRTPPSIKMRY